MRISLPRRLSVLVLVAGLAAAASACSSSGSKASSKSGGATIAIANLKFSDISVPAGTTVTVSNNDNVNHTVTSDDGKSFDLAVNQGKTATFTAPSQPGAYKFHCKIHSTMHGTLTVT